ncbi:hypothetical protein [Periweissella fabalis]|uniref:Uncharacterized protein n=1 Tax=Periweissella fabalis TaxID=1070421 RepID=A0A7X6N254_9LACO|nr:hypothetical protein [Periweissella fabalis]MCM0599569.1 hypothetical protein [Periweissella fabalis]NKZ23874.1 hypothetical protein [Periweissella fabalis]
MQLIFVSIMLIISALTEHFLKAKPNPQLQKITGGIHIIIALILFSLYFWTSMNLITKIATGLTTIGFLLIGSAYLLPRPTSKYK